MNLKQKGRDRKAPGNDVPAMVPAPYPSARYFQVHFEHLEGMIDELRQAIALLREEIAELRQKAAMQPFVVPAETDATEGLLCPLIRTGCGRDRHPGT